VLPGDPRADPVVVDLIELAGLWLAAGDWPALLQTLRRLDDELTRRYAAEEGFAQRFRELQRQVEAAGHGQTNAPKAEGLRRAYRQATVG
jgi:hypothetical protein